LDTKELIQSCESTAVDSQLGGGYAAGEKIVAFLEGDEVGTELFTEGQFEAKLDLVATTLGGFQFFGDMSRDAHSRNVDESRRWEITIGGKIIDLSELPFGSKAVAKFFLQKLEESGLSTKAAFNALKSLCRYAWIQGESSRAAVAMETDPDFAHHILGNLQNGLNRVKIEFPADGKVKISSMCLVSSKIIDTEHGRDVVEDQDLDLSKCYLTAFTSVECTPEGNHTILDSMMAFHR
jgi:hypothetical protein